jgi:thioredoxin reductase (NADPH)
MTSVETIIIGCGPIGLETAVELKRKGIECLLLDAGAVGQQVVEFPPLTRWFSSPERLSIAGVPFVTASNEKGTREEYLAYLRAVVQQFRLEIRTHERVTSVRSLEDGGFELESSMLSGLVRTCRCRHLVLATGGTARPRRLGVPGEDLPHVHRTIGEPHRFLGRRLLVVGGRNSACDSALRAFRCGAEVSLSYRGDDLHERVKYWVRPELEAMIRSGQVRACFNTVPTAILQDRVQLRSLVDDGTTEIPVDDVLLEIGFEADASLLESLGARLEGEARSVVHDRDTMETTVPGLHVVGTAVAGTQSRFKVYIENCHVHARRVAAALAGDPPPPLPVLPSLPES